MSRAILLIDMDAFFASVEQARRPELRGKPVVVGGSAENRGVVSTASYEARACGVRTAMPISRAQRICPQAVYLPVDMAAYLEVQGKLLAIFARFTDLVEPVSVDEAYLDVTGSQRLFGPPEAIAREIQRQAGEELGLSCSIGIGPTKLLAKLAAELGKPGGLTTLARDDVHGRLRKLPVRALSGVGPATEGRLADLGITTIGAPQDAPAAHLESAFTRSTVAWLKELACGGADSPVRGERRVPKSRGHEVTFAKDTADLEFLRATLLDLADQVASDVRRGGYAGRTVVLKIRDSRFRTTGKQRTLPVPVNTTGAVYEAALGLLDEAHKPGRLLRLIGLSLAGLSEATQVELDASTAERRRDEAVDRVRARYGSQAVRRGGSAPSMPEREPGGG
jgi:DNA polymerase IV